jgi:hypothetical protein
MDAVTGDQHYFALIDIEPRIRARELSPVAVTRAQLDSVAFQLAAADLCEVPLMHAGVDLQKATSWHCRHPLV